MAERLHDAALHLAASAERVDHAADVVDRRDPLDAHLAGLDVDGHLGDLHAEGEHAHARRVRAARAGAGELRLLEQSRDLLERPRAPSAPTMRPSRARASASTSKRCAAISSS